MGQPLEIIYTFRFDDQSVKQFPLSVDHDTLLLIAEKPISPPAWAVLTRNQCSLCTLNEETYCPVALNLSSVTDEFRDFFAYQTAQVSVSTPERTCAKETTVQVGLSALIGIIMVTSGCPVLEYLKPMVRFHLPFASILETVYRMSSMYLMSQYFLKTDGKPFDFDLTKLAKIYENISSVNRDFSQRLAEAAKRDANVNALVNLDCFAAMVIDAESILQDIKADYAPYYR